MASAASLGSSFQFDNGKIKLQLVTTQYPLVNGGGAASDSGPYSGKREDNAFNWLIAKCVMLSLPLFTLRYLRCRITGPDFVLVTCQFICPSVLAIFSPSTTFHPDTKKSSSRFPPFSRGPFAARTLDTTKSDTLISQLCQLDLATRGEKKWKQSRGYLER